MNNNFKIIIPLYNVEKWIKKCIRSVKLQDYKEFECIIIDDMSTDKSSEIISKEIQSDSRFKLIKNTTKSYALKNISDSIDFLDPTDDDIIITLDGDDWLANKSVLSTINGIYNHKKCWMTYGSYIEYPKNIRGNFSKKIPANVVKNSLYRSSPWRSSHLRTFKCGLWRKINKNDLINPVTNEFIKAAWDLAFMFPMLEMSAERAVYVENLLYVYNRDNPLNEDKVDHSLQLSEEKIIRGKIKYKRLLSL